MIFKNITIIRQDSITKEELHSFYGRRTATLVKWLNSDEQENRYSEQEQQFFSSWYSFTCSVSGLSENGNQIAAINQTQPFMEEKGNSGGCENKPSHLHSRII